MNFDILSAQAPVADAAAPASTALDFSRWETPGEEKADQFHDLGLTSDQTVEMLGNTYGLSDALREEYDFLTTKNGKLKALLRLSYAFEHLGREATYEQLAALAGTSCNTCYQHGLDLRRAYQESFGLHLTSTKDGLHLTTVSEATLGVARVLELFDKHIVKGGLKVAQQLQTLKRTNQTYALGSRAQALLTAVLTEDER